MDSQTHVAFAQKIITKESQAFAITSLFPQIDRTPAVLHRNYAHYLYKAKPLVELGLQIVGGQTTEGTHYESKRFLDEKARILNYFPGWSLPSVLNQDHFDAAVLGFVSHLHLDTFNQPVQAFTPLKSVCSGQWKMWDEIGDYRYRLYVQKEVEGLRAEWLQSSLWSDQFTARELTAAMIYRLASLSSHKLNDDLVFKAIKDLGLEPLSTNHASIQWLMELENELVALHIRHLC